VPHPRRIHVPTTAPMLRACTDSARLQRRPCSDLEESRLPCFSCHRTCSAGAGPSPPLLALVPKSCREEPPRRSRLPPLPGRAEHRRSGRRRWRGRTWLHPRARCGSRWSSSPGSRVLLASSRGPPSWTSRVGLLCLSVVAAARPPRRRRTSSNRRGGARARRRRKGGAPGARQPGAGRGRDGRWCAVSGGGRPGWLGRWLAREGRARRRRWSRGVGRGRRSSRGKEREGGGWGLGRCVFNNMGG
jgi:hypothetical protein